MKSSILSSGSRYSSESSGRRKKCQVVTFTTNFLETVDDEILFVDDSIDYTPTVNEDEIVDDEPPVAKESTPSFTTGPSSLSDQISLPIQNVQDLLFYEMFLHTKPLSQQIENFIPKFDDVVETGNACIVGEDMGEDKFLIYVIVQLLENGIVYSQETLSVIDKNLKLVHEKVVERACGFGKLSEFTLHIISNGDDSYRMLKSVTKNDSTTQWKTEFKWSQPGDFLSLGANVLMTRRLIIDAFVGCIQSWTCDIDGEFYLSQHWFLDPETTAISCRQIEVQQVDRLLIMSNGEFIKHSSYFISGFGYLLKETCSKHPSILQINPFSELPPKKCNKDLHTKWESDLQLMSLYLEFKDKRKEELKSELALPRIHNVLHDYILCLVKNKPKSVMDFTVDFVRKLERDGNVQQIYQTADRRQQN